MHSDLFNDANLLDTQFSSFKIDQAGMIAFPWQLPTYNLLVTRLVPPPKKNLFNLSINMTCVDGGEHFLILQQKMYFFFCTQTSPPQLWSVQTGVLIKPWWSQPSVTSAGSVVVAGSSHSLLQSQLQDTTQCIK